MFDSLKSGLAKTGKNISDKLDKMFAHMGVIDEELFDELEEILITSDIGVETSETIIEAIKKNVKENGIIDTGKIKEILKIELEEILTDETEMKLDKKPAVVVIVGVNGVGKTTSIGKLAFLFNRLGKKVIIAACDTFRAAATEQLEIWANRANAEIVKNKEGSDPASVAYNAIAAAKARNADIIICDTAGRIHTKKNLMEELKKIIRIIDRELPECSKEILLVIDSTTGQNAISQAKTFGECTEITGFILTKLDGTAKGGIIVALKSEFGIPVRFIGVGEGIDDLHPFNSKEFVNAIFD